MPVNGSRVRQLPKTVAAVLRLSWEASPSTLLSAVAVAVVQAVIPPLTIWLGKRLVDSVVAGAGTGSSRLRDLAPTIAALGIAGAAMRVATSIASHRQRLYATTVELHAERRLLEHVAAMDIGYFDQPAWYDRATRATRDLAWRPFNVSWSVVSLTGSSVALLGLLGLLATLTPLLVLFALLAVAPSAVLQRRVNADLYRFWTDTTTSDRQRQYLRDLLSQPQTAKEVRAFGLSRHLLDRHSDVTRRRVSVLRRLHARADRIVVLSGILSGAALAAAYAVVASRGLDGSLTPGDLAIVIGVFAAVTTQVGGFFQSVFDLDQNATFLQDYFSFLELAPLLPVPADPVPLPSALDDGIRVEQVTFSYPDQHQPALRELSLHVRPGQLLALVGLNGAGKTSLVKLLLRFYDPQEGRITVGGVDIRRVDPAALRARIGVLFQDFARYDLSVRDNVAFGRPDGEATDHAVWQALRAAQAEGVLSGLRGGLDSNVGRLFEGGHDLSGGEWQRLALARLLYRDADIWILDEPTSALDPEVEAAFFASLRGLLRDRIGIILSHRFSTVRAADAIAVMADGRVTEQGTHEELVAAGGEYAKLFQLQAAAYR